jgi:hypothetical protein
LPRRYRPPARRRKTKRTSATLPPEETAVPTDGESTVLTSEDDYDEEWEDEEGFDEEPAAATSVATAVRPAAGKDRTQHLQRDFSYVRTELVRMTAVAAFLVVALIITAILR